MTENYFDLLVIGGGASGACVAYEAVCRGLKVALLESHDLGGGTSSRSTKLLHGGVRYLELAFKTADTAQLRLVREALLERGHWLKQAPFLAHRLELALPTGGLIGQLYYRLGLGMYDALSGRSGIGSSRLLSRALLHEALPNLRNDVSGGVAYSDGQFDDARLNLLMALSAEQHGAIVRTQTPVVELEKNSHGKVCGAISENPGGQRERWQARVVVNATGIHADALRRMAEPDCQERMLTSRGVHVVLKQCLCPQRIGLLLPSTDDGRVLFMLPFFGRTLVGTTDTPCTHPQAAVPSDQEQSYLLNYVKRWFPGLNSIEVGSCWAGGRPLLKPADADVNSSRVVREHEVETLPSGLVSVMGGKWTTCRPMALDTLMAVAKQLGQSLPARRELALIGADSDPLQTPNRLISQRATLQDLLPKSPQQAQQIEHLESGHGLNAEALVNSWSEEEREPLSPVMPICRGELRHAVEREKARNVTDVLARRTRLAMVDRDEAQRLTPVVNQILEQCGHGNSTPLDLNH
ncbi:MAG: glycerol-3-phosphate dehydrogenase [Synechococcus sp. CPC100]|nr:glycerol-3-phosphate dehydrogenase [Synechococcus sp. CPC100]